MEIHECLGYLKHFFLDFMGFWQKKLQIFSTSIMFYLILEFKYVLNSNPYLHMYQLQKKKKMWQNFLVVNKKVNNYYQQGTISRSRLPAKDISKCHHHACHVIKVDFVFTLHQPSYNLINYLPYFYFLKYYILHL
jgi:hypothetical protein